MVTWMDLCWFERRSRRDAMPIAFVAVDSDGDVVSAVGSKNDACIHGCAIDGDGDVTMVPVMVT